MTVRISLEEIGYPQVGRSGGTLACPRLPNSLFSSLCYFSSPTQGRPRERATPGCLKGAVPGRQTEEERSHTGQVSVQKTRAEGRPRVGKGPCHEGTDFQGRSRRGRTWVFTATAHHAAALRTGLGPNSATREGQEKSLHDGSLCFIPVRLKLLVLDKDKTIVFFKEREKNNHKSTYHIPEPSIHLVEFTLSTTSAGGGKMHMFL